MNKELAKVYTGDITISPDARWIHSHGAAPAHWYILRREFEFHGDNAVLSLCSCHYAEAYINGNLVMRFCERSYLFDIKYKSVDISGFVNEGKNTLVIIMDRIFDENRIHDVLAQINSGDDVILVSDEHFHSTEYTPIRAGTNFFIEGPVKPETFDARKDIFAPAFQNGFDDSGWDNVVCSSEEVISKIFDRVSQDKNEMQTNIPVFPKSYVSFEKSALQDGVLAAISSENFGKIFCEAVLTAQEDTQIKLENLSGAENFSLDGNICSFGSTISVTKGKHRLAVIGNSPRVFLEGKGASLSEWRQTTKTPDFKNMGKRVPRFPWNDIRSEKRLPEDLAEFLSVKEYGVVSQLVPASDTTGEFSDFEKIKYRKYISCTDSFCEELLFKSDKREKSDDTLGILGKETIFAPEGEMSIPPSDKDITFILDFGVMHVGGVYLDVTAKSGAEITLSAFEAINENGAVLDGDRRVIKYICKEGRNKYLSHTRKGLRYLFVNIPAREYDLKIHNIFMYEWRFPTETLSEFTCSDERINEVYKMSIDTAKVCMLDAYVDCPGYEQNVWVGDAGVTALVNLCNFGEYDFNERFLSLIANSVSDGLRRLYRTNNKRYISGRFLPCASFPTYPEGNIPIWSYMWVLSVAQHYKHTGDKEALLRLLPAVEETLRRSLIMTSERGLLSIDGAWNLIEWANNDVCEYGEATANSMMLSYCFKEFAKLEAHIGKQDVAAEYERAATRIKDAINKYCWNDERGAYIDTVRDEISYRKYLEYYEKIGKTPLSFDEYMSLSRVSVQTNTFALIYDIADGQRREKALSMLTENIEKGVYVAGSPAYRTVGAPSEKEAPGGIVHVGSPFFMYFVLDALFANGYSELALLSIKRAWGDMIDSGVTTCTETFNSKTEWKTRSVAHAWSASPAIFLITELLGVKPLKPGFTEFEVVPCSSSVDFAKGSVPTPYGEIHVEWTRDKNGNINISCKAPNECKRIK